MQFSKAARAYSSETGTPIGNVDESMLEATDLGVAGWAHKFEALGDMVKSKPGSDGCNKPISKRAAQKRAVEPQQQAAAGHEGSPGAQATGEGNGEGPANPKKAKTKGGENLTNKKEKEMKELLAQEQASDIEMTKIAMDMSKRPQWWSWATEVVADYKRHRSNVLQLYSDHPFFVACKVAALSPRETAKLRKEHKDNYLPQLCDFCTTLGPPMTEACFQLKEMAAAKHGATEALQTSKDSGKPKAKPKAKGKGKAKKNSAAGSSASLL